MGYNRGWRSEKTRGMIHYLAKRPPTIPLYGKQRPSRRRLSHKQPHSEGKQHQPQSSRTCSVHSKSLTTKDSACLCTTTSYSKEDKNCFYNDVDETLGKPNHHMIVQGVNREKNKPCGNSNR